MNQTHVNVWRGLRPGSRVVCELDMRGIVRRSSCYHARMLCFILASLLLHYCFIIASLLPHYFSNCRFVCFVSCGVPSSQDRFCSLFSLEDALLLNTIDDFEIYHKSGMMLICFAVLPLIFGVLEQRNVSVCFEACFSASH